MNEIELFQTAVKNDRKNYCMPIEKAIILWKCIWTKIKSQCHNE